MLAVDVHQHLWPEAVLAQLARRSTPPLARWTSPVWTVELPGEPAFTIDPAEHEPPRRAAAVRDDGLDRALVALSPPVGIEALSAAEAAPLLDAWHDAAGDLPEELGVWAAVGLDRPDPDAARAHLDAGATGLCIAAGALSSPEGLERLGPVLEVAAAAMAPVLVHPGAVPAPGSDAGWWAPSTSYVSEVHAAWHAFAAWGRPAHPGLPVVFALLAGLAPLHAERVAGRGGPGRDEPDPLVFYDTSSYGPRALRAMACAVGTSQLVHGSDRPVLAAAPPTGLGPEVDAALRTDNTARLLGYAWVAA